MGYRPRAGHTRPARLRLSVYPATRMFSTGQQTLAGTALGRLDDQPDISRDAADRSSEGLPDDLGGLALLLVPREQQDYGRVLLAPVATAAVPGQPERPRPDGDKLGRGDPGLAAGPPQRAQAAAGVINADHDPPARSRVAGRIRHDAHLPVHVPSLPGCSRGGWPVRSNAARIGGTLGPATTIARRTTSGSPRERGATGYFAAEPFSLAAALDGSNGAVAFRTSSANFRWLASSCSAKS